MDHAPKNLKRHKRTNATMRDCPSHHLHTHICIVYILIFHISVSAYEWIPPPPHAFTPPHTLSHLTLLPRPILLPRLTLVPRHTLLPSPKPLPRPIPLPRLTLLPRPTLYPTLHFGPALYFCPASHFYPTLHIIKTGKLRELYRERGDTALTREGSSKSP